MLRCYIIGFENQGILILPMQIRIEEKLSHPYLHIILLSTQIRMRKTKKNNMCLFESAQKIMNNGG